MTFTHMNQLLKHIEALREDDNWNEEAYKKLYPEAHRLAGDACGAISCFIGEGRRDWALRLEK
jgi:light-regulated signal transduction histidine kinase (bacteriophytochrome)